MVCELPLSAEDAFYCASANVEYQPSYAPLTWDRDAASDVAIVLAVPTKPTAPVKKVKTHISCACGADWVGSYAKNNPIIEQHQERQRLGKSDPDYGKPCRVTNHND